VSWRDSLWAVSPAAWRSGLRGVRVLEKININNRNRWCQVNRAIGSSMLFVDDADDDDDENDVRQTLYYRSHSRR